ncbi:MAG: hypothetical protein R3A13_02990 [Bdellovibrionota bacterium]
MSSAKRIINSFLGLNGLRQTGEAQKYLAAQVKEFTKLAANSPDTPLEERFASSVKNVANSSVSNFVILHENSEQ